MLGIIDVGGGMRDVFGAGVLDYCIDQNIRFDYCIGVSAGASNLIGYAAHQKGRSKTFYLDYAFRKEYMGVEHFKETGDYLNLEYIYHTLSKEDGENPLNYDAFCASDIRFSCVATDAATGRPAYFTEKDISRNHYEPLAASASLPVVNQPYAFRGKSYVDGGLSDPIPYMKAKPDGVTRSVVILTRPKDFFRKPRRDFYFALRLRHHYPELAHAMFRRANLYNAQLHHILKNEGKNCLIIAPESTLHMKTLKLDREKMNILYDEGYEKGARIARWLSR